MDKHGTDKILSAYWFVILFIVAAAVVYMVAIFYGTPYDIRKAEADAMINQIADCLTDRNHLKEDSQIQKIKDNFLSECNLNFNTEWEEEQYYVEIIKDDSLIISKGNINLKDYCDKKGDKIPKCFERRFYVLDENKNSHIIKIKVVINKVDKND